MKKLLLFLYFAFAISHSPFLHAQVSSVTVDANGNVLNGSIVNFATGKLEVNGVAVSGGGGGGSSADASTTVKGISKLSTAPVSSTNPIAVGDNDSRMTNARTPTAHASTHASGGTDPVTPASIGAPSGSGTSTGTNTGDQIVPANTTATASNWFTAYNSATGAFTKARPAIADLSDAGQLATYAGVTPASGITTWWATPTMANLKAAITDETTVGWNLLTLANPSAISFLQLNADNTVTAQSASAQRTALSLVVGTNVQAWDADLDALAALSGTNTIYYRSAANTWSAVTIGSNLTFSGGTLAATGGGGGTIASTTDILKGDGAGNAVAGLISFSGPTVSRAKTVRDAADTIIELGGSYTPTGTFNFTNASGQTVTLAPAANTASAGLTLTDTTAATSGNQQYSPYIYQTGQGWKTTATAGSQSVTFRQGVVPVQGTANPTGKWSLDSSINGGSFVNAVSVANDGTVTANGNDSYKAIIGRSVVGDAYPGIWFTNGTPSYTNYTFLYDSASALSILNAPTGGSILQRINNATYGQLAASSLRVSSETVIGFSPTAANSSTLNAADAGLYRNAAGVVEINNGTTGQWGGLKLGTRDAATNTVTDGLTLGHQTTGTQTSNAAGLGESILFNINSTTTADQNAARTYAAWESATHASRKAYYGVQTLGATQAMTDRQIVGASIAVATNNTALGLFDLALPTLKSAAGTVTYKVFATDGTNVQVRSGLARYSAVNKAAAYTSEAAIVSEAASVSAGTLTATVSFATGTNLVTFQITPNSSLTATTYYVEYTVDNLSEGTVTVK